MNNYVILTDNTTDLPRSYFQEYGIDYSYLPYQLDGTTYGKDNELSSEEFYERMRKGSMPTTSQVNQKEQMDLMTPYLEEGKDILYIGFSSGLSGTFNSARLAGEELAELYPERKIFVLDSLSASLGEGLLVDYARKLQANGKSLEETAQWVEDHKRNLCHVFTVDDLFHLHRGGRVSKTTAVIGTIVNIKPLLHVDDEGLLKSVGKCRGRKKSLISLADMMEERIGSHRSQKQTIFICHSDCLKDAEFVAQEVKKRFGYDSFLINSIGATIGAHTGPGTVGLFFLGDRR
ncbi:MAG: DegV family protein [Clostridiales bacterium]|nr:DegV family protein [Clostridiales bacterium]